MMYRVSSTVSFSFLLTLLHVGKGTKKGGPRGPGGCGLSPMMSQRGLDRQNCARTLTFRAIQDVLASMKRQLLIRHHSRERDLCTLPQQTHDSQCPVQEAASL